MTKGGSLSNFFSHHHHIFSHHPNNFCMQSYTSQAAHAIKVSSCGFVQDIFESQAYFVYDNSSNC